MRLLRVANGEQMSGQFLIEIYSPEGNPVVIQHFVAPLAISVGQTVIAGGLGRENHRAVVARVTHMFLPDGGHQQMVYTAWEEVE